MVESIKEYAFYSSHESEGLINLLVLVCALLALSQEYIQAPTMAS